MRKGSSTWTRRASTPVTITSICGRYPRSCGNPGCPRTRSNGAAGDRPRWPADLGVQRPGARPQRARARRRRRQERQCHRAGRHRRRRIPGQQPETAPGGHGPRRALGLGHLRTHAPDPLDPRTGPPGRLLRSMERLGRSRSSTRLPPTGCASSPSCPATPPRRRWPSSNAVRRSATAAPSSTSSISMPVIRLGTGCGPRPTRPGCP